MRLKRQPTTQPDLTDDQLVERCRDGHRMGSSTPWTPTYADGRVYVTVDDERMVALDADTGEEQWSWDFPGGATQQYPTIADGKLFVADQAFGFYAIDLSTGETVWSTQEIGAVRVSAYQDGTLFVPGWDGRVTAIDAATGTVRWGQHGWQLGSARADPHR